MGVIGLIGSGKGAVSDILINKEFIQLSHSKVIEE